MVEENSQVIARESKSSFYYAFSLLPDQKRDAMNTVYAFCRRTDDIVDEGTDPADKKLAVLQEWRKEFELAFEGRSKYSLLNSVASTVGQFKIPHEHFFELIRGVEMDLSKNRYETFEELRLYCYRVASTVGLMCIEIFGYKDESAKPFAENLGLALQLTNILRDVKKDAANGRIYLPLEDIKRFGYSEEQVLNGIYNENFIRLMEFETERAKDYFRIATAHLNPVDKPAMFAARAMQHIYYRLLSRIVKLNYDVYSQEIKVPKLEKVGISLGVWFKYNLLYA